MGISLLALEWGQRLLRWDVFIGFGGKFRFEAKETDCVLYFSSAAGLRELLSLLENTEWGWHPRPLAHSQFCTWHEQRVTFSWDSVFPNQQLRSSNLFVCPLDFGRIKKVPSEMNVPLLRTVAVLLG